MADGTNTQGPQADDAGAADSTVDVLTGEAAARKLAELIAGHRFALLTTIDARGRLAARPLTTQDVDLDAGVGSGSEASGELWFSCRLPRSGCGTSTAAAR